MGGAPTARSLPAPARRMLDRPGLPPGPALPTWAPGASCPQNLAQAWASRFKVAPGMPTVGSGAGACLDVPTGVPAAFTAHACWLGAGLPCGHVSRLLRLLQLIELSFSCTPPPSGSSPRPAALSGRP